MRLLMTPAMVTVSTDGSLVAVGWAQPGPRRARDAPDEPATPPGDPVSAAGTLPAAPASRGQVEGAPRRSVAAAARPTSAHTRPPSRGQVARPRRVLAVIDRWRYDGRWWDGQEVHRDYFFVELEGGVRVELFNEAGDWWVARVSD